MFVNSCFNILIWTENNVTVCLLKSLDISITHSQWWIKSGSCFKVDDKTILSCFQNVGQVDCRHMCVFEGIIRHKGCFDNSETRRAIAPRLEGRGLYPCSSETKSLIIDTCSRSFPALIIARKLQDSQKTLVDHLSFFRITWTRWGVYYFACYLISQVDRTTNVERNETKI